MSIDVRRVGVDWPVRRPPGSSPTPGWRCASRGCGVDGGATPVHETDQLAELLFRSFRSDDVERNAVGLLYQGMRGTVFA